MVARRIPVVVALAFVLLAVPSIVRADGEAGVVIDDGQSTRTYCVAFEGESITGEQLLRAAGLSFGQFGGGARTLCSIDGVGCDDASSFDSCFCECKSGAGSCTYWAFFVQRYGGSWQYSTVGFNLAVVRDGDMHGWKWGAGGPSSAPPPAGTSFENVCGHPPQGGASTPTPLPTSTPTQPAATATPTVTASPGTGAATATPAESPSSATSETSTAAPSAPNPSATTGTVVATPATVTVTLVPAETDDDTSDEGSSLATWIGFGVVAGILLAGIGAGVIWRRRHGG